jgi:hypothetical protein
MNNKRNEKQKTLTGPATFVTFSAGGRIAAHCYRLKSEK